MSLLWQLIDSAFPSGGFAHSAGLEACVQHGFVTPDDLLAFARHSLVQAGSSSLPLVTAAHRHSEDLAALDELAEVFLSNAVANRASRAQGRALLTSVTRAFGTPAIAAIERRVRETSLDGHYAPIFGAVFSVLGVPVGDTQRAFLFIALRGVASAAVRLGIVGTYDAQALQASVAADLGRIIDQYGNLGPRDIAQTAPLIDLLQSTHDRLYSRLFQS
jgi:urease accessory protein